MRTPHAAWAAMEGDTDAVADHSLPSPPPVSSPAHADRSARRDAPNADLLRQRATGRKHTAAKRDVAQTRCVVHLGGASSASLPKGRVGG